MNIAELKAGRLLLLDVVAGSRAYGTDLPTSDADRRGVFVLPKTQFYGLQDVPQITENQNNDVYFELRRCVELMAKNNPNIMELLGMPEDCIVYRHPLWNILKPEFFISKLCQQTFAGYAMSQVQKARGLKKKIVNPVDKERKCALDFCYIIQGHGSQPLVDWIQENGLDQRNCGLVSIPHFRDTYALFYDETGSLGFCGIQAKPASTEVSLSSIPEGMPCRGTITFNRDGYLAYCRQYREYWTWVEERNPERYANTISHGKNYDAKNMLHTFRLLDMAEDIARYAEIRVRRPNRDFLLKIRAGNFEYDELLRRADEKLGQVNDLFSACNLPDTPDMKCIDEILFSIRDQWYHLS